MAATWNIGQMEDYVVGPEGPYEGENRVVYTLHWECTDEQTVGTGEDEETHRARVYSSVSLEPFDEDAVFTPWGDVTEVQALEWLHDTLGAEEVTRVEESLAEQLNGKINPVRLSGVPW